MSERTPLLNYRLSASCNESAGQQPPPPGTTVQDVAGPRRGPTGQKQPKKLTTFFGVVVPTLLSMFSVVVFLRIGFMVGQCGLYQAIAMYLVAYFIITMTVLSVCAISTNGALDAGGAYWDLKNPSYSIPRGTITAVIFTFIIYNLLMVMAACTCDRCQVCFRALLSRAVDTKL
ncbi:unnamed protein product [Merluccius merluccius]